jgi:LemA protein
MELLYGLLGFAGSMGVAIFALYNQLVSSRRKAEQAIVDLSTQFTQRDEAAQALIEIAKKYVTIDPVILQKFNDVLANVAAATVFDDRVIAENQLSSLVKSILSTIDQHGPINQDQQFAFARQSLADTEGLIQRARVEYSAAASTHNTVVSTFPSSLFARFFGYKPFKLFEYSPSVMQSLSMNASMQAMMMQSMMPQQPMQQPMQQQNSGSIPGFPSI